MKHITDFKLKWAATILRIGLGSVFLIGGINKLSQLLSPAKEAALVASYMGTAGYINAFFAHTLFNGLFTPWGFLTLLSTFELISGALLICGLFVRLISLIYGFLLWTFVMALPVTTTPGVVPQVPTFLSPALLVQVRDIVLSGLMFVLFNLGSGAFSLDHALFRVRALQPNIQWDNLGLLLRLSLAAIFIVGGLFAGLDHIQTYKLAWYMLLLLGIVLAIGLWGRWFAYTVITIMLWYMWQKLNLDKTIIANLNGFKREFAFIAAGIVLAMLGGGRLFTLKDVGHRVKGYFAGAS